MALDDILNPVQGNGQYAAELPLFGGMNIWKACPRIIEVLQQSDRLFATTHISHSYPHCWRHKTPVIYRAAAQWFIRMDEGVGVFTRDKAPRTLRQLALDAIEQTAFYPENGRTRLRDMIAGRPDWCISRQRNWGVPLPFFIHRDSGELHPRTMEILDQAADMVERGGIEAWSKASAESIIGEDDARQYTKSNDILEVWFDSGTTHTTVLKGSHPGSGHDSGPEADLYLEGHDQHRGWFHSSLLTACAMFDRAPYRGLLTHGFTVDSQGRKMSKSLGNGVDPQETSKKLGAEIIRLWVAASDYSGDIAGDDKILARVVDTYRRIRNTLKFLLANTSDFDPATQSVAPHDMLEIDRYALARAAQLQADILAHYKVYEFHPVVAKLQIYCSEDLGAFYLDILKDRLYTTGADSLRTPLGPDRVVADHPGHAALDGAVPELHCGRGVECAVGRRQDRAGQPGVDLHQQVLRIRAAGRCAARQVAGDPLGTRHGEQGNRGVARIGQGRLLAAGTRGHRGAAGQPCRSAGRAAQPGRRPALRVHHLGRQRRCRQHAQGHADAGLRSEMRTLLALPPGCGP